MLYTIVTDGPTPLSANSLRFFNESWCARPPGHIMYINRWRSSPIFPLAPRRIPHLERFVDASANNPIIVGAEGHAKHRTGMFFKGKDFVSCVGIPHLERLVPASADDPLTVGAIRL